MSCQDVDSLQVCLECADRLTCQRGYGTLVPLELIRQARNAAVVIEKRSGIRNGGMTQLLKALANELEAATQLLVQINERPNEHRKH